MSLGPLWFVPLGAAAVGAGILAWLAARLRGDVAALQASLRPVRVERDDRMAPDGLRHP